MPPPTRTFIFVDAELDINKNALSVFFFQWSENRNVKGLR